jgi:hypothetical protein
MNMSAAADKRAKEVPKSIAMEKQSVCSAGKPGPSQLRTCRLIFATGGRTEHSG